MIVFCNISIYMKPNFELAGCSSQLDRVLSGLIVISQETLHMCSSHLYLSDAWIISQY